MFLLLFVLNWLIGRNRNWAKWSEIDVTMFLEISFSDMSVEKVLSIRVPECEVIRVGDVIWGTKEFEYFWSRKSVVLRSFLYFSKSMLKSPNKTIYLLFSGGRFWLRVFKNASFYPSTFLQPVNGSKNWILNWVLKLNLFKSL